MWTRGRRPSSGLEETTPALDGSQESVDFSVAPGIGSLGHLGQVLSSEAASLIQRYLSYSMISKLPS